MGIIVKRISNVLRVRTTHSSHRLFRRGVLNENRNLLESKMQPENVGNNPSGNPYNRKNNFRGGRKEKQNIKLEETVDDIRNDLKRIEKEIELEIKEINALKLGL